MHGGDGYHLRQETYSAAVVEGPVHHSERSEIVHVSLPIYSD